MRFQHFCPQCHFVLTGCGCGLDALSPCWEDSEGLIVWYPEVSDDLTFKCPGCQTEFSLTIGA